MKNFLRFFVALSIFIFTSNQLAATHIMGGEVTWECNGTGQYVFTYKIYRDCSGNAINPNNSFAIHNYPNVGQTTNLTVNTALNQDNELAPRCRPGSGVTYSCAAGDPEVVFEYVRVMQPITLNGLPPAAGWTVTYDDVARNASDNQTQTGITLRATIFNFSDAVPGQCVDNSPQFREKATSLLCTGTTFTYNHNATDDELDSLAYEWAQPLNSFTGFFNEGVNPGYLSFTNGYSFNNPFPGPEVLNTATGEITLNPPVGGKYVSVVKVSAFKCGEKVAEIYRELQSVISNNCSANQTKPTINAPFQDANGNFTQFSDTVQAGDLVTFNIQASDFASLAPPYLGDSVTLTATGLQFGTNFTSTTGCNNPPCATLSQPLPQTNVLGVTNTFSWQTDCNHVSFTDRCISGQNTYVFVITATDDECPIPAINIATISVTVVGDTVIESPLLNCVDVQNNGDVNLDWDLTPNVNSSFSAWLIYSSTDRNGPFTLIDSVKTYNQSTYTHVGANADQVQRFYNVRSRSGCKGRVVNIARDTVSTIFMSAVTNPTDVTVSWSPLNTPNPSGSSASYNVFREFPVGSGFSLYQTTSATSIVENFTNCEDTVRYRVELSNTTKACSSTSNIFGYRYEFPQPQTNFTAPATACPGTAVNFTNLTTITGGTITYSWDFGDGSGTSTSQNPSYTYTTAGTYTVTLLATSGKNCDSTFTRQIIISGPAVDAGPNVAICPGGSVAIGGSPTTAAGNTIAWSPSTGLSSTNVANPTASPSATTIYTVTVTDASGCSATDQVTVSVNSIPTADAGPDKITCNGQPIQIGGSPTGPTGAIFRWSPAGSLNDPNIENPIASPGVTTTYTVTVTNGVNCSAVDQVVVSISTPPNVNAGTDKTICLGETVLIGGSPTSSTPGVSYLWDNSTTLINNTIANPSAFPATTRTYTVTVTDGNGCTSTDQVVVNVNPNPTADAGPDQQICGSGSIQIGGSPTSTTAGASYQWDNAASLSNASIANPTASPATTTTYTVTVTHPNGCTATDQTSVSVNPIPTADAGSDQSICIGNGVTIGGAPTGPGGATFNWSPSTGLSSTTIANPVASPTATTTYTVTVTSGLNCTATDQVLVTVNPLPNADAGPDLSFCNSAVFGGGQQIVLGGSPTSTTAGATYSWSPAADLDDPTLANPEVISPTMGPSSQTYTVTVTDLNGCTAVSSMNLEIYPEPVIDVSQTTPTSICPGGTVTLDGTGSQFGSNFIIRWSSNFGSAPEIANPNVLITTATPTRTTTYTLTIEDINTGVNCISSDQVTIIVNPVPDVDAGVDRTICLNGSVQIGGSPTSTTSGVTYSWDNTGSLSSGSIANPIANPLVTTTYTVTVTDGNGCTATDQVTVTVNALPLADAGTDKSVCNGGSIQIGGAPTGPIGSSFAWDNAASLDNATIANPTASPTVTTTYTVTVTDGNGCTATDQVVVNVGTLPTADAGADRTICEGSTSRLGGAPTGPTGATYQWDNTATLLNGTVANPTANPLVTTTYTVTVTDGAGCSQTDAVTVTVDPVPTVDAGADQTMCINNPVVIGGSPTSTTAGATYSWNNASSLNNSTSANPTANPIVTTIYTVTVTHPNGCTATDQVTVTVNTLPIADAGADQTICDGQSTIIGGSPTGPGGATFLWDNAATLSSSTASNPTATPLTTTTYSVTITDGNNCSSTDQVTITVNPLPDVDAGTDVTICENASTTIGGSPTSSIVGATFAWDNGGSLSSTSTANPIANPLVTTTYTVTVTHPNGCTATDQITVTVNPAPLTDAGADQSLCNGGSVQIGGSPTGPTGSTFTWDNAATLTSSTDPNPFANPTVTTTYTVTVTDVNGCTNTDAVIVNVNTLPVADAGADRTICEGSTSRLGGAPTGPIGATYQWDNTATLLNGTVANPTANPTVTTTYTVTVTDAVGCSATDQVTVTVNPLPTVDAGPDVTICETQSTSIGGLPTSATVGASYAWDNATTLSSSTVSNPIATPTTTTTYTVTVTHPNGCTATDQLIVTVDPIPSVDFTFTNVCVNDMTQFTDISTITSGSIQSWIWDFGDGTGSSTQQNPIYQYASTGSYTVKLIVESASGCKDSISKVVTINPLPNVDAGADQTICNTASAILGGSPTSTTSGVSYAWDNIASLSNPTDPNPTASPSVTTTYTVTVTDANGCFDTDQVTITVNPLPVVDFSFTQACSNELTQFTDLSTISSGSNQLWTWDFGDGVGTSGLQNPSYQYSAAGTYMVKLIVESALGCKDSITKSVTINPVPTVDFSFAATCLNDLTQFTDLSSIPSGSLQSWTWNFGDGVGTSNQQNPSYQYTSIGTFAVKLVVESSFGCKDSITKNVTITPLPDVDAGADQTICNTATAILGGSPTSTVAGVTYAWDNGASLSNASDPNPIASPSVTTTYTVTVTDANGCFDTDQVTITVDPLPVVDFSFAATCLNDVTQFTDLTTISSGTIQSWSWDFGDGTGTSIQRNPSYQFLSVGSYNVKLVVESSAGCLDSITKVVVINPLPDADAGADQIICNTQSATLGGAPTSTSIGASYAWDNAGSLNNAFDPNPIATPSTTTVYTVTVTDLNGCVMTDQVTVFVNPLPTVDFSSTQVCLNDVTQFTDLSSIPNPSTLQGWLWDFGDGVGVSTQQNPTYTYSTAGTFNVKLIVVSNLGCIDSLSKNVIVDTLPTANAGADRAICQFDTTILGEPSVSGETYVWDNATTLSDNTVSDPRAFPLITTTYSVTVTNTIGCSSVDQVTITVNPAPDADAGPDQTICDRDTVTIGGSPTSTAAGATYLWNNAATLDDATSANPKAFPSDTTEYVVLVTDGNGCTSTDTIIINVNPLPTVDFRVDALCENDFTAFTNESTISVGSIVSWEWNFGDGVGTSNLQNPAYQYASDGTFNVTLKVTSLLGCVDSIVKQVDILPLPNADAGNDRSICFGDTITLGGNPTGTAGSFYKWSPGLDLSSVTEANPRAYPLFTTTYFLTVTAANGCTDFDTVEVVVNALPNVTAMQDSTLCVDQPVQLTASGADFYSWSPTTWLDDPTIATPIVRAQKDVKYIVRGTDANGCIDTDTVSISVFNVDFIPEDTSLCLGDSIELPIRVQGNTTGITYSWSPISAGISDPTVANPTVFPTSDQYFKLQITNADGCTDTDSALVTINDTAGVSFEVLNSPRCSGSVLEIRNTSVNVDNYIWKLNGEIRSDISNPPDLGINNTIENTLTLIGSNATCTDSVTQTIAAAGLRELLQLKDANVFTPNGDGLNDIYDPGFEGEFIGCVEFQVFDRWGTKVFDSNIGQYGWDGRTLRGRPAPTGIYYYVIKIANETIKGSVYLTR